MPYWLESRVRTSALSMFPHRGTGGKGFPSKGVRKKILAPARGSVPPGGEACKYN